MDGGLSMTRLGTHKISWSLRPNRSSLSIDDLVRTISIGEGVALIAGSMSAAPFERFSHRETVSFLNFCQEQLRIHYSTERDAVLLKVFAHADSYTRQQQAWTSWLIIVILGEEYCRVGWVGGDEVWLLDGNHILNRTEGHTLQRQMGGSNLPHVFVRGIGAGYPEGLAPATAVWPASKRSELLLLSDAISMSTREAEISALSNSPNIQAELDRIVEGGEAHPYAYAVYVKPM